MMISPLRPIAGDVANMHHFGAAGSGLFPALSGFGECPSLSAVPVQGIVARRKCPFFTFRARFPDMFGHQATSRSASAPCSFRGPPAAIPSVGGRTADAAGRSRDPGYPPTGPPQGRVAHRGFPGTGVPEGRLPAAAFARPPRRREAVRNARSRCAARRPSGAPEGRVMSAGRRPGEFSPRPGGARSASVPRRRLAAETRTSIAHTSARLEVRDSHILIRM